MPKLEDGGEPFQEFLALVSSWTGLFDVLQNVFSSVGARTQVVVCRELKKQGHPVASLVDLSKRSSPSGH